MGSSKVAIVVALVANSIIAVAKFAAAFFTGSSAMLAEAYHSVSDTMNQVALLWGLRRSVRPADDKHPFGYGKATFFWSFVVAMLLFGVAGTLSFLKGIDGIRHPHDVAWHEARWALLVLLIAFLVEAYALFVSLQALRVKQSELKAATWREAMRRTKDAPLVTIIYEDALALAGVAVAAGGVGLAVWTGDGRFDAWASLLIGVMLMGFALMLARRNKDLLLGESMDPRTHLEVAAAVEAHPLVEQVVSLRSMHLAPDHVLLAGELAFSDGLDTDAVEAAIDDVEARIRHVAPSVLTCYIEARNASGAIVKPMPKA